MKAIIAAITFITVDRKPQRDEAAGVASWPHGRGESFFDEMLPVDTRVAESEGILAFGLLAVSGCSFSLNHYTVACEYPVVFKVRRECSHLDEEPCRVFGISLLGLVVDVRDAEAGGVSIGPSDDEKHHNLWGGKTYHSKLSSKLQGK